MTEPRGEIRVSDLMLSLDEYATVSADATISDALHALSKAQMGLTYDRHHHRAVLVLDGGRQVVGKLTHWGILQALEPRFFSAHDEQALARAGLSPDEIAALASRSRAADQATPSLAIHCAGAARVRVRDAMVPITESVDEQAPLAEAIRMLVLGHWQSVLVRRGLRVVGILRMADVFEEVADLIRASTRGTDPRRAPAVSR